MAVNSSSPDRVEELPVAWRWRYVHPGRVNHWHVRQSPSVAYEAGHGFVAREVEPLYTRPESESVTVMREALEKIEAGSNLGKLTFELRVKERKGRLTWYAVNVLEDNLAACAGTASEALARIGRSI